MFKDIETPRPQSRADFEAQRAGELVHRYAVDSSLVRLLQIHDPKYNAGKIAACRDAALRALRRAGFELIGGIAIRREMLSDHEFVAAIERLALLKADTDPAVVNAVLARLDDLIEARVG